MRKRSTEILQKLIKDNGESLSIKRLASQYGTSQKTLRNDVKEINYFLNSIPMPDIKISDRGELVKEEGFDDLIVEECLYEMGPYNYKMSTQERQIYILMILATSQHHLTMQRFAEELYVSRITIVNDIEVIKKGVSKFGAELITDPGKGIMLKYTEKQRIQMMIDLYREISIDIENNEYFQRMVLNRMNVNYKFADIFSHAQEYMQMCNMVFVENVLYDIILYLFVVFNFGEKKGKVISRKTQLTGIEDMIFYAGHMLKVGITDKMLDDFCQYIEENNLHSFVKTLDEIELYKVIMKFVGVVGKEIGIELENDKKLMDSLLLHIQNMRDWGNYEVELPKQHNSLINYELLLKLVEENAYILENFLSYELSDNMIRSIVIHICVAIIRNERYMPKLSVVIVCPGSMATGKYLEAQIRNYFDFRIIDVIAVNKVNRKLKEMNEKVDFIISTVQLKNTKYSYIKVHPFLTMEDMNKLQKISFEKRRVISNTSESTAMRLMSIIKKAADDENLIDLLYSKIMEVIREYQNEKQNRVQNAIAGILHEKNIYVTDEILDWREAMRYSAEPLIAEQSISVQYIEKAIENVEEYGGYIAVSKGVALAHADKDSGVFRDCLSLLVSKEGIEFPEVDDKVHLLFCFAAIKSENCLDVLKDIISLGRKEGEVERIRQLNDLHEIYKEIIYEV